MRVLFLTRVLGLLCEPMASFWAKQTLGPFIWVISSCCSFGIWPHWIQPSFPSNWFLAFVERSAFPGFYCWKVVGGTPGEAINLPSIWSGSSTWVPVRNKVLYAIKLPYVLTFKTARREWLVLKKVRHQWPIQNTGPWIKMTQSLHFGHENSGLSKIHL